MFISFEPIENSRGTLYPFKDTEFEIILTNELSNKWQQIADIYEIRNMNVAKNLFLFIKDRSTKYKDFYYSIGEFYLSILEQEPLLAKYKEEIEKYLLLE
jgi:hypothetical protein